MGSGFAVYRSLDKPREVAIHAESNLRAILRDFLQPWYKYRHARLLAFSPTKLSHRPMLGKGIACPKQGPKRPAGSQAELLRGGAVQHPSHRKDPHRVE